MYKVPDEKLLDVHWMVQAIALAICGKYTFHSSLHYNEFGIKDGKILSKTKSRCIHFLYKKEGKKGSLANIVAISLSSFIP
jgi:hypothetical protein